MNGRYSLPQNPSTAPPRPRLHRAPASTVRRPVAAAPATAVSQTPLWRHFYPWDRARFFLTRLTFRRLTERLRRLTADPTRGPRRCRSVAPLTDGGTGPRPPASAAAAAVATTPPPPPRSVPGVPRRRRRRRGGAARDRVGRQVSVGRRRTPD